MTVHAYACNELHVCAICACLCMSVHVYAIKCKYVYNYAYSTVYTKDNVQYDVLFVDLYQPLSFHLDTLPIKSIYNNCHRKMKLERIENV